MQLFTILLPAILSLAATTVAADTCPKNWLENTFKGDTKCCYGNMLVEDRDAYCCVYDMNAEMERMTATSETTSSTTAENGSSADFCFTKVPFTAGDYSSLVSSASRALAAITTGPSTAEATSTDSASSKSSSGSGSGSAAASTSASFSETGSSNAAGPVATAQGVVLGGAAIAAAFFV